MAATAAVAKAAAKAAARAKLRGAVAPQTIGRYASATTARQAARRKISATSCVSARYASLSIPPTSARREQRKITRAMARGPDNRR